MALAVGAPIGIAHWEKEIPSPTFKGPSGTNPLGVPCDNTIESFTAQ